MTRQPPRLGRGLATLFQDAAGQITSTLPASALVPGPFQPRSAIQPDALEGLAESIKSQGVLQPLLVRHHPDQPGMYQIIAGERRWRAAQTAGLHVVPVHVRTLTDAEALAAALVENLQRLDLDPIEEAEGYHRLGVEFCLSHDELGKLVGKSRSHIANTVRLLQLMPGAREHLKSGALTAGHARALLGHPDAETMANMVIAQGLNVRQTEALARRPVLEPGPSYPTSRDENTVALEQALSAHLGLRVRITQRGSRGEVQLGYTTLDQLDGLVRLLQP